MPKYRNPPTKYEIHCLKIEIHEIHKLYEIHIDKAVNKPTGSCYSIDIMHIQ